RSVRRRDLDLEEDGPLRLETGRDVVALGANLDEDRQAEPVGPHLVDLDPVELVARAEDLSLLAAVLGHEAELPVIEDTSRLAPLLRPPLIVQVEPIRDAREPVSPLFAHARGGRPSSPALEVGEGAERLLDPGPRQRLAR